MLSLLLSPLALRLLQLLAHDPASTMYNLLVIKNTLIEVIDLVDGNPSMPEEVRATFIFTACQIIENLSLHQRDSVLAKSLSRLLDLKDVSAGQLIVSLFFVFGRRVRQFQ